MFPFKCSPSQKNNSKKELLVTKSAALGNDFSISKFSIYCKDECNFRVVATERREYEICSLLTPFFDTFRLVIYNCRDLSFVT